MIYLDTSVLLAELLAEDHRPEEPFWSETLISSRLLEYEVWTRLHARGLAESHGEEARALIGRVGLLELVSPVVMRALEPFPRPVRTLDALHLASADFLRQRQPAIRLASYDSRLNEAARGIGIKLHQLDDA
jgi:predicted nucleic acid-binding protein